MEVFKGRVQRIITQKDAFLVFTFAIDKGPIIKCTGEVLLSQGEGEQLEIEGDWFDHPKFGRQFKVSRWEKPVPIGKEAVIEYLASGIVKGVAKKMAERIVNELGEQALDRILEEGPRALAFVPKLGEAKAVKIHEHLVANIAIQKIMTKLMSLGLSPNLALKVYKKFGENCMMTLQKNPYQLMQLPLVGFQTADKFAQKIGFEPDSLFRIQAGLKHVLDKRASDSGDVYILHDEWLEGAVQLFQDVNVDPAVFDNAAGNLEANKQVIVEKVRNEIRVYPKQHWYAEKNVAEFIARRLAVPRLQFPGIEKLVGLYEKEMGIILSQKQREAVCEALVCPLFVLTGGPGTGKTTVTRAILWCYQKLHPQTVVRGQWGDVVTKKETALCAPTGRAARRMSEVTKHESKTIHRLLGFKGALGKEYDKDNRYQANYFIIDESSMMDLLLGDDLFQAIPEDAQVVLVGDVNQLPSVGAGQLLHDLIEVGVPSIRLDVVQRQAQDSNIIVNAHRIHEGKSIVEGKDFFFVKLNDNMAIQQRLIQGVRKLLNTGWTSDQIQILTPMRKGELGTIELNRLLQETINPPAPGLKEVKHGHRILRVGDRVMQTSNNYQMEVFNGEIGFIRDIVMNGEKEELLVEFDDGMKTYSKDKWNQLEHANAVTIHKSQGGEYPIVLIPITTSHYVMLFRNILYTGVTRAKQLCGIIGMQKAWEMAIQNVKPVQRNSGIKDRVAQWKHFVEEVKGAAQ